MLTKCAELHREKASAANIADDAKARLPSGAPPGLSSLT